MSSWRGKPCRNLSGRQAQGDRPREFVHTLYSSFFFPPFFLLFLGSTVFCSANLGYGRDFSKKKAYVR